MPLYTDIYRQTILRDGPFSYYRLNEDSKSGKAIDDTGNDTTAA